MTSPVDSQPKLTLAEKVWRDHVVTHGTGDEPDLIFIDLQLLHEVTSPQAFDGLRLAGRTLRHPELHLATEDHNVPTTGIKTGDLTEIADSISRTQVSTLRKNCEEFGVRLHAMGDINQGIVHQVGPQLGATQPGMTIVCGDSHTSTHGAFGAMAFGIGTSEVEHVMATQTLALKPFKTMAINVTGELQPGVTAKDLILAIIAKIGTGGGQTTFDYVYGRELAPTGDDWDKAVAYWKTLPTDEGATFDTEITIDGSALTPFVTWGTNPGQGLPLNAVVPSPDDFTNENDKKAAEKALTYMGLTPGTPLRDIKIDTVFLGSCTNARIEDLRTAAHIMKGHKVADTVRMMVVPSTTMVKQLAEAEGLDKIFTEAGADWRSAGCSMCLGMNPDQLKPGERSASTSNRNFEGRQGPGGRTHLVSPEVAAATAIMGTLASPADLPTHATS